MKYENKFQERFIMAVRKSSLKQIEIAERTGISRAQISEYLKGKCKPKQDKVHMLARVLNVDPTWLMGYEVPMQPTNPKEKYINQINDTLKSLDISQLEQVLQMLKVIFPKECD